MSSHTSAFRFGSQVFNTRQIQETLCQEIERLERQLDQVKVATTGTRQSIANTYRDMIPRRRELLDLIRVKALPLPEVEGA